MSELIRLAIPVILTGLGPILMGTVDIYFVSQVSTAAVGAVALCGTTFATVLLVGIGLLTSLDYFISFSFGKNDLNECHGYFTQGLWIAFGISIPLTAILWFIPYSFKYFGVPQEVINEAIPYCKIIALTISPTLIFIVCRQYLQAIGIPSVALIILILGNIINALLNYALVLGNFNFPKLNTVGSGYATLLARIICMVMMFFAVYLHDPKVLRHLSIEFIKIKKIIKLGLPASMQMLLEASVFTLAGYFAARLGTSELAAHQIVLNIATLTFHIPYGLGLASSVLVGRSMGEMNPQSARLFGWTGLYLGTGFMAFSCLFMFLFPDFLLGLLSQDAQVIEIGKSILIWVAIFQLADGAQVILTSTLRGLSLTKISMLANLIGHWFIGFPLGLVLAFKFGFGLVGIWSGLSIGLFLVALILFIFWKKESSRLLYQIHLIRDEAAGDHATGAITRRTTETVH